MRAKGRDNLLRRGLKNAEAAATHGNEIKDNTLRRLAMNTEILCCETGAIRLGERISVSVSCDAR